jgi:hypothetical protein
VREPVNHGRDMRQEFLAKLYFALKENPETIKTLVTRQKAIIDQWLADIDASFSELSIEDVYDRLVLESRKKQIIAWRDWLNESM